MHKARALCLVCAGLLCLLPASASAQPPAYITQWGTFGSGDGHFKYPEFVAVDGSGNVYVSDRDNNRIQEFSGSGAYLTQWGTLGGGDGQFADPWGVAVDGSGRVYVADTYNNRVQVFGDPATPAKSTSWGRIKALYR